MVRRVRFRVDARGRRAVLAVSAAASVSLLGGCEALENFAEGVNAFAQGLTGATDATNSLAATNSQVNTPGQQQVTGPAQPAGEQLPVGQVKATLETTPEGEVIYVDRIGTKFLKQQDGSFEAYIPDPGGGNSNGGNPGNEGGEPADGGGGGGAPGTSTPGGSSGGTSGPVNPGGTVGPDGGGDQNGTNPR